MFNKRDHQDDPHQAPSSTEPAPEPARAAPANARASQAAVIGASIEIDGTLKGDEDLVVEGRIKGTVVLKQNTLTVGSQGRLDAEIFAHSILVDGTVHGDLYASERISIRKTARIQGNILAPRISLDDGATFRGSIDMDAESEAFRKAFGKQTPEKAASPAPKPAASAQANGSTPSSKSAAGSSGGSDKQKTQGSAA
jgi:cytoskeletal protein CcmA (bactofilin family)